MGKATDKELIVNGRRLDGREPYHMREIKMSVDEISSANGSAKVSFGKTTAYASVHGPRSLFPKFLQESDTGILRCRYNMAPFSVDDRKSPGPDRRSVEISKVIRRAFEPVLFLEDYPKSTVDSFIEIVEADGSTRVTGINALSMALASAGIPMKDLVAACSVGKISDTLIVDLNGVEDNNSESDVGVAMMPQKDIVTLLQMDGILTKEELVMLLNLARESCKKIYQIQKQTLMEKYRGAE
ncbi:MAG: exosome complex exonuclease Rrp41 [Candidatus Aenigmarchaeota archaeon]|nr:exosome complex exonuclease Rrp41 [Candidatus Aenigmarchaeota archaeon]